MLGHYGILIGGLNADPAIKKVGIRLSRIKV